MTRLGQRAVVVVLGLALAACASTEPASDAYVWILPEGFPPPAVPADNPMNASKVELGRHLFYDTRLSGNGTLSCGGCHRQELAFTDARAVSLGSTGESTPRGSMSLANVAYVPALTWANRALLLLEDQALVPMFGDHPVELGLNGMEDELLGRLRAVRTYRELFPRAFPSDTDPFTVANVIRAIAAFERTMLSGDSPYDRYWYQNDDSAMSASALRGKALFESERLECFHCHGGFNFTDSVAHAGQASPETSFHNNALYNVDGRGAYPVGGRGLYEITNDPRDMGLFRAPTLRNIELTAPYMHDGSAATLDDVLDHYAAGGRTLTEGPNAGIGANSRFKSIFLHGFTLTPDERADLLEFLRSLTDRSFVEDPRFAPPATE